METKKGFVGFIIILILVLCCCCITSALGIVNVGKRSTTVNTLNDPRRDQNSYPKNHL